MGELTERAEAGLKKREQKAAEERQQQAERWQRQHDEKLQPVVEYLTKWSGEEIHTGMLHKVDAEISMEPPQWDIEIDGFQLRVAAVGKEPEDVKVHIEQRVEGHGYRPIEEPWQLLESELVAAP